MSTSLLKTLLHPSARYSSLVRQRIRVALGAAAALAAISLSPGSAQAYVVIVSGVQYDVTTFTGSYNDNISKFETAANGGVMPWWNDGQLAFNFATQVSSAFGYPNTCPSSLCTQAAVGPYFARYHDASFGMSYAYDYMYNIYSSPGDDVTWAQATLYTDPAPVPAPLPLLGAALPLSFCRRLSSRSKRLRHGASRLA